MKKAATLTLVLALLFSAVAGTQIVKKARAETITVPDDYDTIQDAINAANEGDTIFVKKGIYEEHALEINKTLSLIGEDKSSTIIKDKDTSVPKTTATVQIVANDVKVTGFTITDGARGIDGTGDRTQIIDNIIMAEEGRVTLEGNNHTIAQNIIKSPENTATLLSPEGVSFGVGYGIRCIGLYNNISANEFAGPSLECIMLGGESLVYGNVAKDSGFMKVYGDKNLIFSNNMTGFTVGIWLYTGSNNVVCANRITLAYEGISISGYDNTLFANEITNCSCGVSIERLQPSLDYKNGSLEMNNTFYHNNFVDNSPQLRTRNDTNFWDNGKEGNFWSDYNGTDANGDGIGDTPRVIDANRQDNFPLMAPFDISSVTVELPDWASPSPSLEPNTTSPPFPTALVIALVVIITVEGIGLLIYFKKRKR